MAKASYSEESKGLYKRLVTSHMDPTEFGIRSDREFGVKRANSRDNPYPIYIPSADIYQRRRLTKTFIEDHLCPHDLVRVYLENSETAFLHPMAIDIDGCDANDARQLAALIQQWLYEQDLGSPTIAIPSTNGAGCHIWMLLQRARSTTAPKFNKLVERMGRALSAAFPRKDNDLSCLCPNGCPIKGTVTWTEPNPEFNRELAEAMCRYRRSNRTDFVEKILDGTHDWTPAPTSHQEFDYQDGRRVIFQDGKMMVLNGAVRISAEEAYQRSKVFRHRTGGVFVLREKLERWLPHHGTLIAFPGAGNRAAAREWCDWYDQAIRTPVTLKALTRIGKLAPAAAKLTTQAPSPVLSLPEVVPYPDHLGSNRSWLLLSESGDKLQASMGAAQIALQQRGLNATVDDVLDLYEQHGPATGQRDRKRTARCASALKKARRLFDPALAPRTASDCDRASNPEHENTFNDADVSKVADWLRLAWPDLNRLRKATGNRKVTYEIIATVFCFFAKYTLANVNGQISRGRIIKSMKTAGVKLHPNAYTPIKDCLIGTGLLYESVQGFMHGKYAKCYQLGQLAAAVPGLPIHTWRRNSLCTIGELGDFRPPRIRTRPAVIEWLIRIEAGAPDLSPPPGAEEFEGWSQEEIQGEPDPDAELCWAIYQGDVEPDECFVDMYIPAPLALRELIAPHPALGLVTT